MAAYTVEGGMIEIARNLNTLMPELKSLCGLCKNMDKQLVYESTNYDVEIYW
jgi:hypothetical protein